MNADNVSSLNDSARDWLAQLGRHNTANALDDRAAALDKEAREKIEQAGACRAEAAQLRNVKAPTLVIYLNRQSGVDKLRIRAEAYWELVTNAMPGLGLPVPYFLADKRFQQLPSGKQMIGMKRLFESFVRCQQELKQLEYHPVERDLWDDEGWPYFETKEGLRPLEIMAKHGLPPGFALMAWVEEGSLEVKHEFGVAYGCLTKRLDPPKMLSYCDNLATVSACLGDKLRHHFVGYIPSCGIWNCASQEDATTFFPEPQEMSTKRLKVLTGRSSY